MSQDVKPLLGSAPSGETTRANKKKAHSGGKYSLLGSNNRIHFPSSSSSALYAGDEDPDAYDSRTSGYRPTPTRDRSAAELTGGARQRDGSGTVDLEDGRERRPNLPKLSRECLWSEFKCYGTYIFPPLAIFGVLAVGISLTIFGWKKGWFDK